MNELPDTDTEQFESGESGEAANNPYAPPVDSERATYDHSLFWRFARAILAVCLVVAAADLVLYVRYSHVLGGNTFDGFVRFLTGDFGALDIENLKEAAKEAFAKLAS